MILRNGKFSGKILRKIFHLTSLDSRVQGAVVNETNYMQHKKLWKKQRANTRHSLSRQRGNVAVDNVMSVSLQCLDLGKQCQHLRLLLFMSMGLDWVSELRRTRRITFPIATLTTTNPTWTSFSEPGPPWWRARDQPPEPRHGLQLRFETLDMQHYLLYISPYFPNNSSRLAPHSRDCPHITTCLSTLTL
jgi:hypothetical protein